MKIYISMPNGTNKTDLLSPEYRARINALGEVDENNTSEQIEQSKIKDIANNYDAILTSWGMSCIMGDDVKNSRLKFIGHIAGSVQGIVDESVFDTDVNECEALA